MYSGIFFLNQQLTNFNDVEYLLAFSFTIVFIFVSVMSVWVHLKTAFFVFYVKFLMVFVYLGYNYFTRCVF